MTTSLSEFIAEINRSRKNGLLSVTVKGANTLLKLFFREGELYHLTFGNCKGAGCLARVLGNEFADYFFMPEVSLNVQDGDLPPLTDLIQLFRGKSGTYAAPPDAAVTAGPPAAVKRGDLLTAQEQIKLALIRQIGPAGAKVMTRTVEQKWQSASPPSKNDFLLLIDLLKDEIENANDRNEFLKEARAILS
jgi:hypothetical protein